MTSNRRSGSRISALLATIVALACGSESGTTIPTEPDTGPGFMVGNWVAESMVVTSVANPDISPDIVGPPFHASFTLAVQPSGRYTAILSGWGQSSSESGTLFVEGSEIVFMRQLPTPGESRALWERDGSAVVMSGGTNFDFNLDGTTEPATLRSVLIPQ